MVKRERERERAGYFECFEFLALKYKSCPEKEPAVVSLARRIASSSVLNSNKGATGQNTSSLTHDKQLKHIKTNMQKFIQLKELRKTF